MSLEKAGDIVREAYKNKYGVASFNGFNYETMKFVVEVAEEAKKSALFQFYPGWHKYMPLETAVEISKALGKRVKVPVGLHLDHCYDIELLKMALNAGFTSVMYDGSKLPFEENIKNTREVVKIAKEYGADVEAELGNIGSAANVAEYTDKSKFTDPGDALELYNETGIFSLAVAVGNAHGNYAALPNLEFELIKKIDDNIKIPLVLHGGSGIPDEQIRESIKFGIAKINVATDYFHAFYKTVEKYVNSGENKQEDIFSVMRASQKDAIDFLVYKINAFN